LKFLFELLMFKKLFITKTSLSNLLINNTFQRQLANKLKMNATNAVPEAESLDPIKVEPIYSVDDDNPSKKIKTEHSTNVETTQPKKEIKNKKKRALLISYCGEGYYGLQRNPSNKDNYLKFPTIEDEIVNALVKIEAIPQNHADDMYKMSFQRAARTDKGVSACANLLTLKLDLDEETTLPRLNEILPKQIRVFGYNKVTQGFDAKTSCDSRTYIYILPTYAFCPIEQNLTEDYRADDATIESVNKILSHFLGTHNYHNFTAGKKFTDPSSKRYIMSFECGKPFIRDGSEFAVIKIKGQSFMLHQIRKMIGFTIAIQRGLANLDNLENCWTAFKVIPSFFKFLRT
jgi:tRNA pseudouridine38-40 synthase